ncbi:MAG: hypothetical protein ACYC3I_01115 [Gemmataceae bacterium]
MNEWEVIDLLGGTVVLVLVGWWLRHLLRFPKQMTLFDVCVAGTAFFAGTGPWVGFVYGKGSLPVEDGTRLLATFVIILSYLATIVIVGYLAHRGHSRSDQTSTVSAKCTIADLSALYKRISPSLILFSVLGLWAFRVMLGVVYGHWSTTGGTEADGASDLPYVVFIVNSLLAALASGCLLWSSRVFWTRPRSRGWQLALIILILELAWAFTIGRRMMFGWVLIVLIGFFASGNTLQIKHAVAGALFAICFLAIIFPLFHKVRQYRYLPSQQNQDALPRYFTSLGMALTSSNEDTEEEYRTDMAERPLIHRFISQIREKQETREPMGGEALWTSIFNVIPSAIIDKSGVAPVTEDAIHDWYGLPDLDSANTWPATGCADFGMFGGVIAGLIVGGAIWLSELMIRAVERPMPFISLCCMGSMIDLLYQFENDPIGTWCTLRGMVLLIIGGWVLGFFWQNRTWEARESFAHTSVLMGRSR